MCVCFYSLNKAFTEWLSLLQWHLGRVLWDMRQLIPNLLLYIRYCLVIHLRHNGTTIHFNCNLNLCTMAIHSHPQIGCVSTTIVCPCVEVDWWDESSPYSCGFTEFGVVLGPNHQICKLTVSPGRVQRKSLWKLSYSVG